MNRLRASLLQGSILALAAACGLDAQAQSAGPPPGKALVVLYRSDKQPVAARVPLIANADRIGDIGNGEFVNAIVNPGRTFLRAGDKILTTLAMQTSANQTYYVLVQAVPGMTPVRVEMREASEIAGRLAVAQSRPAATAPPRAAAPAAAAPAALALRAPAAAPLAAAPAAIAQAPRSPAAAPPPPRPAPAAAPPEVALRRSAMPKEPAPSEDEDEDAELRKWRIAVIAKTGVFKLATASQTFGGLTTTYDKSSKPVFGFEAEFRHLNGFALGAEIFYYKNDFTAPAVPATGQQTVISTTLTGKYYFGEESGVFHPFLGGGVGFSAAKFGGDFQGQSGGPAFQGMLGADFRFSSVGLYLEYKYLSSTTSDNSNQKIKVGGSGVLAGVSFEF